MADEPLLSATRRGAIVSAAGLLLPGAPAWAQSVFVSPQSSRLDSKAPLQATPNTARDPALALPATEEPPPVDEDPFTLPTGLDGSKRLSVPVMINGKGPFPFVIDTGADHTILSAELARALGLPAGRPVRLHSIAGESIVPTVKVARLEVGSHAIENQSLALLTRRGLGAPGLLGLDAVADQRVTLDFRRHEMTLRRSKGIAFDPEAIVVRAAARRSGQLLLVDSTVRAEPVFVILDTGAELTIANSAVRDLETRRRRVAKDLETVHVVSVTGEVQDGLVDKISDITLEKVRMHGIPVAWSDLHVFKRFGVEDKPAVLLGSDVLSAFERVEIDFGRREVGFVLRKTIESGVSHVTF